MPVRRDSSYVQVTQYEIHDSGPTASRLMADELRILIIGNSPHHTKSLLFLVRELARLDPSVRATVVSSASEYDTLAELVSGSEIRPVSFERGATAARGSRQPQAVEATDSASGFLTTTLKKVDRAPLAMPILGRPLKAAITRAKHTTPGLILRERVSFARLKREKRLAARLFDQIAPNLVVAFGDRHPDIEAPILLVARERGVKVVIPYVVYSGKDIMVEVRKNEPGLHARRPFSLYRWRKAKHFRHQLHEGLFYQPPNLLAAYEKFGALSSYPWCLGNGLSDVICVDSETTAQRYQNDRVNPEKITIIGDVVYDKIADSLHRRHEIRAAIIEKYGLHENLKLIVLALPQLAEQGVMDWESHWKEIRFLVDEVSRAGQNLLISLHPRADPNEYAFLETEYSCRIAQERLSDFVCAADVFMANYSSTVIWAVLCGIKTVVVDFYGLNYRFFDYLTSVTIVRDRERLPSALVAAVQGGEVDFSADWKALSRQDVFDGRTIQRYLDLFLELAAASTGRRSTPTALGEAI